MNQAKKNIKLFNRLCLVTIFGVYFLILVGGIVRSTGSGMGCPDWPKCFGKWIPPTVESELPPNYKDVYAQKRIMKNQKVALQLRALGWQDLALKISNDPAIARETDFNASKTWTEYVNRLIGALIGLLVFSTFLASIPFLKTRKTLFYFSLLALVMVGFQGWVGSLVVSTSLLPGMVTFHMVMALVITAVLIYLFYLSTDKRSELAFESEFSSSLNFWIILCLVMLLGQIVLGTQVRESIDKISASQNFLFREEWIGQLGTSFLVHRSYSLLIFGINLYLVIKILRIPRISGLIRRLALTMLGLILAEIAIGAAMAYLAIPAILQPLHLFIAALIFGIQFLILLSINWDKIFLPKTVSSGI